MKDDSQVGVAIRDAIRLLRDFLPRPGARPDALPDVTEAERQFVHKVRELHPDSPRPPSSATARAAGRR